MKLQRMAWLAAGVALLAGCAATTPHGTLAGPATTDARVPAPDDTRAAETLRRLGYAGHGGFRRRAHRQLLIERRDHNGILNNRERTERSVGQTMP